MSDLKDIHHARLFPDRHREAWKCAFVMDEVTLAETGHGIQGNIESFATPVEVGVEVGVANVSQGQRTKVRQGFAGQKLVHFLSESRW